MLAMAFMGCTNKAKDIDGKIAGRDGVFVSKFERWVDMHWS